MIANVERVYGDILIDGLNMGLNIYDSDGKSIEDLSTYKRYVLFPKEGLILYNDYLL